MKRRVLVVDDHEPIRRLVEATLGRSNYTIIHAGTGEDALRLVRQAHPDLVLLDIALPGASGIDVCRAIKSDPATKATKVVFLSAYGDQEPAAKTVGGDAFLTKPFRPLRLLDTVEALLAPLAESPLALLDQTLLDGEEKVTHREQPHPRERS